MKKTTGGIKAVVVGLAIFTLFAKAAPAAERSGFETYVVQSGDTLSKISGRVFGDVKRWREILKENPQITNANRIFPGDVLLVPVLETAAGPGGGLEARAGVDDGSVSTETMAASDATGDQGAAGEVAVTAPEGEGLETTAAEPALPVERARPIQVVSPARYRSAGHLAGRLPTIAIVASPENRILFGTGDAAIVNASLPAGARFTVVRANRRIFHPVTGAYLGWLIRILGSAEVTCPGERASTVTMAAMNDAAGVGDYLVPADPSDVLEKNEIDAGARSECLPAGASGGVIVAFDEERSSVGEYDLAYIDRGTEAGVNPGQRFTIYREVAPEGRIAVGELQVLRAGARTSTTLITTAVKAVQVGYLLRAR